MKSRWFIILLLAGSSLLALAGAVSAQDETPPPPYAGMKNPFDWDDAIAQDAGKTVYQQQCSGCHGTTGGNLPAFDFSKPAFSQELEAQPDFFFWVVSEGRLTQGMPGYKSSLSAEQLWQTLTYMWTLGKSPPPTSPITSPLPPVVGASLSLESPGEAETGQPISFTASLKDSQGFPVSGATVKFFLAEDFFTSGDMEIDETVTDDRGLAYVVYTPTRAGTTVLRAKYETVDAEIPFNIRDTDHVFYQSEAGLPFLSGGPELFVGPESAHEVGEMGSAPTSALRLPGGIFSWLWVVLAILLLIWGVYFIVMYQVLHIPGTGESRVKGTGFVPVAALIIIVCLGLLMFFMVITGPYSHFHLIP
ncbi:MAG: hypothetical protein A2Z29_09495 [Chloroflexi bacterium RBG_16_56_11]|nr:MAG: hypothetical protein A2Z29_09495 [Chloroflexi bacterium RBG_16_56_11]